MGENYLAARRRRPPPKRRAVYRRRIGGGFYAEVVTDGELGGDPVGDADSELSLIMQAAGRAAESEE